MVFDEFVNAYEVMASLFGVVDLWVQWAVWLGLGIFVGAFAARNGAGIVRWVVPGFGGIWTASRGGDDGGGGKKNQNTPL